MKTIIKCAVLSLTISSFGAEAIQLSDNNFIEITPTLATEYRFGGISQSQGDPVAQLDVLAYNLSGIYAGVFTSTIDFGHDLFSNDDYGTRQEVDYYAGYYWQLSDNISLDTYYLHYTFPGEGQFNGSYVHSTLDVYGFLLGGRHSHDIDDVVSTVFLGYRTVLPYDINAEVKYERVDFKDDIIFNSNFTQAESKYDNWEVSLKRDFSFATLSLSYVDTSLSDGQCFSLTGYQDLCGSSFVGAISKKF